MHRILPYPRLFNFQYEKYHFVARLDRPAHGRNFAPGTAQSISRWRPVQHPAPGRSAHRALAQRDNTPEEIIESCVIHLFEGAQGLLIA